MDSDFLKIPEIKIIRKELQCAKREVNKKRIKFKSILLKYNFIKTIISPTIDDTVLEYEILKVFKNLGYKTQKPKIKRNFDRIVKFNNCNMGIEVKNQKNPEENELFQAFKYSTRSKAKGEIFKPLTVWNNTKSHQNFDQFRIDDAINNKYGLITTAELLKGFIKVKQGKITIEKFEKMFLEIGLIIFSNKAILESG